MAHIFLNSEGQGKSVRRKKVFKKDTPHPQPPQPTKKKKKRERERGKKKKKGEKKREKKKRRSGVLLVQIPDP